MITSRLHRREEQLQKRQLLLAMGGMICVILFLLFFGINILINFSVFVDKLHGTAPVDQTSGGPLLPPSLDPLPEATKSGLLSLSGRGQSGKKLILYLNETEYKRLSIDQDGVFTIPRLELKDGLNVLSAKTVDEKGNTSDLSNIVKVLIKKSPPLLEITTPQEGAKFSGDPTEITITGKTEENVSVTVNDRLVVVRTDGSFTYTFPLASGDTTLKIVATDQAGNQKTVERKVTYSR